MYTHTLGLTYISPCRPQVGHLGSLIARARTSLPAPREVISTISGNALECSSTRHTTITHVSSMYFHNLTIV